MNQLAPTEHDGRPIDTPADSEWLCEGRLAYELGVSRRTVVRWMGTGRIPEPIIKGRNRRWHREQFKTIAARKAG